MMKILNPNRFVKGAEHEEGHNSEPEVDLTNQSTRIGEIVLPPSVDGKDRFISIEKLTPETISPLVSRDISVEGIIEVVDRSFSYPLTAHVGLKIDSRTFANMPEKKFDVKMKKVKVPSNYFSIGGNGLDRRYVYSNPNYDGDPNNLDVVFVIDQNLNAANRRLIKRNLKEMLGKLCSGYNFIRASIWQTSADKNTVINKKTGETITNFTHYETYEFFEVETPDASGNNNTNLYTKLNTALDDANQINIDQSLVKDPVIASFFLRRSQFGLTDEAGTLSEKDVLKTIWYNTVRKVIYISGTNPDQVTSGYNSMLNFARENGIQFYYIFSDAQDSNTNTLREFAIDTGGGKFNMMHKSDIEFQQFCDEQFYDNNRIYYGDWDGTFKIAWTDNPAWILYDILTNTNYGLGNHIDQSSVDKWTLYDIARYCDAVDDKGRFQGVPDGKGGLEPRYTCNIIFYNKDEAYKVIKDISAVFKGITYWNTEGFSFFADRPKEPIMFFGNSDVVNGLFNYSETAKNTRHTSVEIVYNDKYDNYKTKIEFIEDVDGIKKFGLNPFRVNAAGCTSRSEARRIGRYILYSSMFEADTVSFTAGLNAAYLQPGDVFGVSDEIKNVAKTFGRVLDVNEATNKIRIDNEFANGLASGIFLHVPSGNYAVSDLNSMTGSNGGFTGNIETIRARRQSQVRKFNLHTVDEEPGNSYGALLTVTGDFLLKSGVVDTYVEEGRVSGSNQITGESTLTGLTYIFPANTVLEGNPRWDTVKFLGISGLLTNLQIEVDVSGTAGTGQLIANEPDWECLLSYGISTPSTISVNNVQVQTVTTNKIKVSFFNTAGVHQQSSEVDDLNGIWNSSAFSAANADGIITVVSNGAKIANNFVPSSDWNNYGATEVFKIGKDVSSPPNNPSISFGYAAAFIKGGSRIIERASKGLNDYGRVRFKYRDLLALSKLRPYYTLLQADIGNRRESFYENWASNRYYEIGNIVKKDDVVYTCRINHYSSDTFTNDYLSNDAARTRWTLGANFGYSTIAFPKNFPALSDTFQKVPITTPLTSTHVANALKALGIEPYVGNGPLGQSDIKSLASSNGIGYSGLVYGTGYEKGFYSLSVDTTPKNLDLISEGSLYVLSGSGVEPKLYKTIATKEEEANQYSVIGIEYIKNKEDFIEKDMIDTSPDLYVKSVYDVILKPDAPASIVSTGKYLDGQNKPTGIYLTWSPVTTSPITGYKIYVSKPDYSASNAGAITEAYFVTSGAAEKKVNIPVNDNWGQYDINIYSQGPAPYRFLSEENLGASINILPNPSLSVGGQTMQSVFVSGMYVETADTKSLNYSVSYSAGFGTHIGAGNGNFTSRDLVFRWAYMDPTGGIIDSVESMRRNPFVPFVPKVKISVLDIGGNVLHQEENYQGFSYKIDINDNKKFVNREDSNWEAVQDSRNFGLRVEVTDINNKTFTGIYNAYNIPPEYSNIEVVDCFQNSPYYIISGVYGNVNYTRTAVWNSGTDNVVTGSGLRNYSNGTLLRSEDETRIPIYEDIVSAFTHAKGIASNGSVVDNGITITQKGVGTDPDYAAYVFTYEDLTKHYYDDVLKRDANATVESFGKEHYLAFGQNENRTVPKTKGNPLGISNLSSVAADKVGFSGLAFTIFPEKVADGRIEFNCYSAASNKDVLSVDLYTGIGYPDIITIVNGSSMTLGQTYEITSLGTTVNWTAMGAPIAEVGVEFIYNGTTPAGSNGKVKRVFDVDLTSQAGKAKTFFKNIQLQNTRSYINSFSVDELDGLTSPETGYWYYFRLMAKDDFGYGPISNVVSGFLKPSPKEIVGVLHSRVTLDGGADEETIQIDPDDMVKNYNYKIAAVGASVNWTAMGAGDNALDTVFQYNGTTAIGSGGKVVRMPSLYYVTENDLGRRIIVFDTQSNSTVILPSSVPTNLTYTFINKGQHIVYIKYKDGELVSILRKDERVTLINDENGWTDTRGNVLAL